MFVPLKSECLEALRQWNRVVNSPIADVRKYRQMRNVLQIHLQRLWGLSDDQVSSPQLKGFQSEGLLVGGQDNVVYADVLKWISPI